MEPGLVVPEIEALSHAPFQSVEALERAMIASGTCFHVEPTHVFHEGKYLRSITVPADSLMTGHRHRDQHIVLLSKGDITVWAHGEPHRRLQAPAMFVVEAGSRRIGFAHTETVWTTVHLTAITNVEQWETECLYPHEFLPIPSLAPHELTPENTTLLIEAE